MATRRIRSGRVLRYPEVFTAGLSSAVLEWLLIILLFVNALFSYFVTKFARYCNLKTPCLLCSRLDHVLGNEKPGFYKDLICASHKLEISSLVFCHLHEKLADVHGMCEGCLFSFAAEKRSNSETYKLLVGKLGIDHGYFADKSPIFKHSMVDPLRVKQCTCCNELWKTTSCTQRIPQKKLFGSEDTEFDFQLPGSMEHGLKLFDGLKKKTLVGHGFDTLSHIGYSELKITSESESEFPISDDDDASALIHETNNLKDDVVARRVQLEHPTIVSGISEASTSNRLIDQASQEKCELAESQQHVTSSTSLNSAVCGLEELNWQQFKQNAHSPVLMDFISFHDVPSSSNAVEVVVEASRESFDVMRSGDLVGTSSNERGVCMLENALTPETVCASGIEQVVELSREISGVVQTVDAGQISSNDDAEASKSEDVFTATTASEADLRRDPVSSNPVPSLLNVRDLGDTCQLNPDNEGGQASSIPTEQNTLGDSAKVDENSSNPVPSPLNVMDLGDTCRLNPDKEGGQASSIPTEQNTLEDSAKVDENSSNPVPSLLNVMDLGDTCQLNPDNEGGQASSIPTEQNTPEDSAKVDENSKQLVSAIQGSTTPVNNMSPRVHGVYEELKVRDASSSIGLDTLQKRILIEKNESGFESLDESISEIEGESSVDHLRRQVEYDQKCISALYKELDEERNASADAANEAMAMITRLQEEKAALHMEALQYLRMMEEQAEYDVEALQKANDLLAEKEKEIQDLEAELDYYRIKYPDEDEENIPASCDTRVEHSGLSCSENNMYGANDNWFLKKFEDSKQPGKSYSMAINKSLSFKDCLLSFEDERLYIYQSLRKLEKKLNLFNDNGLQMDMCNGVHLEKEEHRLDDIGQENLERDKKDEDVSSLQNDFQLSRGGSPTQERSSPSSRDSRCVVQGNHYFGEPGATVTSTIPDLVSIESEILDLNERLETLEADKEFLEHAINSLQNGNEGIKFIQEIAYHLRELQRIGIKRREKEVA